MEKKIIVDIQPADLMLYMDELKEAFRSKWNSLFFSENRNEFLSLLMEDRLFTMTTMGDTAIMDENGIIYRNDNQEEIRYLFEDNKLQNCAFGETNWFSLIVEKVIDERNGTLITVYEDNITYHRTPASIEELEEDVLQMAHKYLKEVNK